MKKRMLAALLLSALLFTLSGCGEKSLLNKKEPVSLTFWHVYGEQAGSPMDLLVQEFNRTVGQERGVQVKVTGTSSASKIGGYLKEAQSGGKDVQERLRHVAGTQWGNKKYMNMKHLEAALYDASIAG